MNDKAKYKLGQGGNLVLSDGERAVFARLLRDCWEDFDQTAMQEYFDRGYDLLFRRLNQLKNRPQTVSPEEENDLYFMVESLVYAKNALIAHQPEQS
jgi:hypothetical protein